MKFKIKDLKKLLYSIQHNHVHQLKIKNQNFELIVNKTKTITTNHIIKKRNFKHINKVNASKTESLNSETLHSNPILNNNITKSESEAYSTIISPMVGTFYRSPAPNEPAFVETYDIVEKKQTVCIIEAMKLMNEIEAEVSGEIVEILVQDGDIVDCGQALMKVKIP